MLDKMDHGSDLADFVLKEVLEACEQASQPGHNPAATTTASFSHPVISRTARKWQIHKGSALCLGFARYSSPGHQSLLTTLSSPKANWGTRLTGVHVGQRALALKARSLFSRAQRIPGQGLKSL
uniref:Uncharacterized protein n=1 Tax=Sphaerodactylus townsendi TaxID=933632 RepID=A0ACB8G7F0_9SAUR